MAKARDEQSEQTRRDFASDMLFDKARSQNGFLDRPLPISLIVEAFELARMGPTSMNSQPMRLTLLTTPEAKERLIPALMPGNVAKTRMAPVTAIIAYDSKFFELLPRIFPHSDVSHLFAGNEALAAETAFRNGTIQGAYFMLALRAIGVDSGAMSGFDRAKIDAEFYPDGRFRSNWLLNIGFGDPSELFPRLPRLDFDDIAEVL